MHFIVTGGAGFIGNHLVHYLINKGHSVDVIDNIHVGRIENLNDVKNKITFYKIDILEYNELRKIAKNADGIFHEAALTSVQESFTKSSEYNMVNVIGTENIFKLAKEFGFKVVYASSTSVYGNPSKIPVKEDFPRKPVNPYGETKLQAELLAEKYISNGVTIIGLRYFNVYGKGQSSSYAGVITKFLERIRNNQSPIIYGDGLQGRDFVYVDDVAKANLLAMEKKIPSSFINIGSGEITSIRDLAQMMIDIADLRLKPIYDKTLEGDVRESLADISLAKKLLGWEPEMKLKNWLIQILQSKND
ncbi:MAG: NAD-dependent epimerase/dehydratase family protein [Thaumarchaeota archaeon]|nr:NAD-dependent epimerase/dehydratase family protein [Nitrososphaerota archaeon]